MNGPDLFLVMVFCLSVAEGTRRVHPVVTKIRRSMVSILEEPPVLNLEAIISEEMLIFEKLSVPKSSGTEFYPMTLLDYQMFPSQALWNDKTRERFPDCVLPNSGFWDKVCDFKWPFGDSSVVRLGRVTESTGNNSTVYAIPSFDNAWAVRYTSFCPEDHEQLRDPPVIDQKIIYRISQVYSDVAVQNLYMSGTLRIPSTRGGKLELIPGAMCAKRTLPLVRYTITERTVKTLEGYLRQHPMKRIPMALAAVVGLKLIKILRKLHGLKIVHGDIQLRNIVIRNTVPRTLVLQQFGSAVIEPTLKRNGQSMEMLELPDSRFGSVCASYGSPWELKEPPGYRDDVFRVIQLVAVLVHGTNYAILIDQSCTTQSQRNLVWYSTFKDSLDIFNSEVQVTTEPDMVAYQPYGLNGSVGVPDYALREVNVLVRHLLNQARIPQTRFEPIDYDTLETWLGRLILAVS